MVEATSLYIEYEPSTKPDQITIWKVNFIKQAWPRMKGLTDEKKETPYIL